MMQKKKAVYSWIYGAKKTYPEMKNFCMILGNIFHSVGAVISGETIHCISGSEGLWWSVGRSEIIQVFRSTLV